MADSQQAAKNKRRFDRLHWRVPCTFRFESVDRRGFVTDLSAGGLFVHTSVKLEPGTAIMLTLDTDDYPPMVVSGVVARRRNVHRNATMVQDAGGMGIRLDSAPEEYYQLVASLSNKSS